MAMAEEKKIALQVLEYWHAIEFLEQSSYKACKAGDGTRQQKNRRNVKGKTAPREMRITLPLQAGQDVYGAIREAAEKNGMPTWENLTFYIDRVRRQTCILRLQSLLQTPDLPQAEENTDEIAVLSFQCDAGGRYIPHSLSLSPVVWSMSRIGQNRNQSISDLLSERSYKEAVAALEKEFFMQKQGGDETAAQGEAGPQSCPVFGPDAICADTLRQIHRTLQQNYGSIIDPSGRESLIPMIEVKLHLLAAEKSQEDPYTGLGFHFFDQDLKMVRERLQADEKAFAGGAQKELLGYICAPHDRTKERNRHDLVQAKDRDGFADTMLEILDLRHAPLGKWPSRYMPALMQQVAINLATADGGQGVMQEAGRIFSVNGPPGTGKTTMLKEVIAAHIVEKARLLSRWETPQEAFAAHSFQQGPKENGSYSSYFPRWYSFKDDKIAEHSVLVVSSNNAAVENITKELPMSSGIRSQMAPNTRGSHPDSEAMQRQLAEVSSLFLPDAGESDQEHPARKGEDPEGYFTQYARKLLGTEQREADAWGLIAVPLGRKTNIGMFYRRVLKPFLEEVMRSNQKIEERVDRYRQMRQAFLDQLNRVEKLRDELQASPDAFRAVREAKRDARKQQEALNRAKDRQKNRETSFAARRAEAEKQRQKAEKNCSEWEARCRAGARKVQELEQSLRGLQAREADCRQKVRAAEKDVSLWNNLFHKNKYLASQQDAQNYVNQAEQAAAEKDRCAAELETCRQEYRTLQQQWNAASEAVKRQEKRLADLQQQQKQLVTEVQKRQRAAQAAEKRAERLTAQWRQTEQARDKAPQEEQADFLDDALLEDLLSSDEDRATRAQLVNPWVTQHYNREREKLLYLALEMTKAFVLSSKACRCNLHLLAQYWQMETPQDAESVVFGEKDRQEMVSSLFQTLWLMTPVISSTFASVGQLLKDVTEPGSIGTLMIDEAGQAQPQMAVGAIYRARRVLVVGDPKQVEPVVTEDLKLLKDSFSQPVYSNYKDKSLSVQSCADQINPFGTFFENGTDYPDWVGCPLLVHRRCISPMYDISNAISYGGIMKQQTLPPSSQKAEKFLLRSSQWLNVAGAERGGSNHYVPAQGAEVARMVEQAFAAAEMPNLYIISPFKKVIAEMGRELRRQAKPASALGQAADQGRLESWMESHMGTVHKFQGKEADEVIFLLGCDARQKDRYAVTGFVNSNMVNVAVTRAKYRLYIVGDARVWQNNPYLDKAKEILDVLPLENLARIQQEDLPAEEKQEKMLRQAVQLPGAGSLAIAEETGTPGETEWQIDTDAFVGHLDRAGFLAGELSEEQLHRFGFGSRAELQALPEADRNNLQMAMKLYFLLEPVYKNSTDLDMSCCGILFCKATEMRLRENFVQGLKDRFPLVKFNGKKLIDTEDKAFMIGKLGHFLEKTLGEEQLAQCMQEIGQPQYTQAWWNAFLKKLTDFGQKRNACCHPQIFGWQDMQEMLHDGFAEDAADEEGVTALRGVFFSSEVGQKLRINEG